MLSASLPCRARPKLWPQARFSSGWIPWSFPEVCAQPCPCCAQFGWTPWVPAPSPRICVISDNHHISADQDCTQSLGVHQPCPAPGKVPAALTLGSNEQLGFFPLLSLFLPPLRGKNSQRSQFPLRYKIGGTDRKRSRSQEIKIGGKWLNPVQNFMVFTVLRLPFLTCHISLTSLEVHLIFYIQKPFPINFLSVTAVVIMQKIALHACYLYGLCVCPTDQQYVTLGDSLCHQARLLITYIY